MAGIDLNSPSVQTYLTSLQGVISRMANNSAQCKTMCVAVVAAIIALSSEIQRNGVGLLGLTVIPICCLLDCHYLSLERGYRQKYNEVCHKLRGGTLTVDELFNLAPPVKYLSLCQACKSFQSWSVWTIYTILAIIVLTTWFITKGA